MKTMTATPIRGMIGSHLSIAGGLHLALLEAIRLKLDCLQVFTRNQRQWKAPPLSDDAVRLWKETRTAIGWDDLPQRVVSHNSYLVNLASPDPGLRAKSIELQRDELERCERLGIAYCVAHPGAHLGAARAPRSPNPLRQPPSADEEAGLRRIASSLDELHRSLAGYRVITCIETTTGSGTNLGYDFGHLARIRELVAAPERIAFCFDTCHVVSAGYDMSTESRATATLEEFWRICGQDELKVMHVNDSAAPPGSRVDRHEHIGAGTCTKACFQAIMRNPRLALVPKIMETAKEDDEDGRPWDLVNAQRLRAMLRVTRDGNRRPRADSAKDRT
ncbi:MAG: deoxyribonuclease IV [Phycisphaerales bacterium]